MEEIIPYVNDPLISDNAEQEHISSDESEEEEADVNIERIDNTDWYIINLF